MPKRFHGKAREFVQNVRLRFNLVEIPKPPKRFERIVDSLIFLEKYSTKTHLDAVQERLYRRYEKREKIDHTMRHMVHFGSTYFALKDIQVKFKTELKGKKILQVGGGPGTFMKFLNDVEGMDSHVLDIDEKTGKVAKGLGFEKRFIHGDAREIPFENNSLDFVFENNFLDPVYWSGKEETIDVILKEIHRVLKMRGFFVIQEPYFMRSKEEGELDAHNRVSFLMDFLRHGFGFVRHVGSKRPGNCVVLQKVE